MERRLFKSCYTTTLPMDTTDVFFDIATSLMRVYEFEIGERSLDYLINGKNRVLVVTTNKRAAIVCKMVSCEKKICESLTSKENVMSAYGITEDDWERMIKFDPTLDSKSPSKRTYEYEMELTVPEEEYQEFMDIAIKILMEIC